MSKASLHCWPAQPHGDQASQLHGLPDAALHKCSVAVLGLGAVGGTCLQLLARLGVGTLLGVDPDSYGPESWRTQPSLPTDAGRAKALIMGQRAHAINPGVRIETLEGWAQEAPLAWLRRADAVVVAGDNRELLVWAGTLAAGLGRPLVQGAVHGRTATAFVRGYGLRDPANACPGCSFSAAEWGRLSDRAGCDPLTRRLRESEPTRTSPTVCGMAAHLVASEVGQWLSANGSALQGEELAYCLDSHRCWRTQQTRNAHCRCPHRRWQVLDAGSPETETMARLSDCLGWSSDSEFAVRGEIPWNRFAFCSRCGRQEELRRFSRIGRVVGSCPCGHDLQTTTLGARSIIPVDDQRCCLNKPLAQLGLEPGSAIGLGRDDEWTYFVLDGADHGR